MDPFSSIPPPPRPLRKNKPCRPDVPPVTDPDEVGPPPVDVPAPVDDERDEVVGALLLSLEERRRELAQDPVVGSDDESLDAFEPILLELVPPIGDELNKVTVADFGRLPRVEDSPLAAVNVAPTAKDVSALFGFLLSVGCCSTV